MKRRTDLKEFSSISIHKSYICELFCAGLYMNLYSYANSLAETLTFKNTFSAEIVVNIRSLATYYGFESMQSIGSFMQGFYFLYKVNSVHFLLKGFPLKSFNLVSVYRVSKSRCLVNTHSLRD